MSKIFLVTIIILVLVEGTGIMQLGNLLNIIESVISRIGNPTREVFQTGLVSHLRTLPFRYQVVSFHLFDVILVK